MSWSHLIIIERITWSLATIYLKPKYAAWPQAISSNSLRHGRLPKTISTQALFLDFGLLGVCHMAACHNPSQTIVCCLAACRNPSAPRVCHMAACRNPSAPRVCRLAACHFPPPKLEVGTQLCRLDACHFPPYRHWECYQKTATLTNDVPHIIWAPRKTSVLIKKLPPAGKNEPSDPVLLLPPRFFQPSWIGD